MATKATPLSSGSTTSVSASESPTRGKSPNVNLTRTAVFPEDYQSNGIGDPRFDGAEDLLDRGATRELQAESAPRDDALAECFGDGHWQGPLSEVVTGSETAKKRKKEGCKSC